MTARAQFNGVEVTGMLDGPSHLGQQISSVRAVVLDYGEVLCLRPKFAALARMAEVFRIEPSRFFDLYVSSRSPYDQGLLTAESYWLKFAHELGVRIDPALIDHLRRWDREMWSNINPEMTEWLERLHGPLTTALLSNMEHDMAVYARRNFAWLSLFHYQLLSCELGLVKPDPAIFHECTRVLGVQPRETLFVDDRQANIDAARGVGMRAIRFQSVRQLRADLQEVAFPILPMPCEPAESTR